MSVGDMVRHPEHRQLVKVVEVNGDMIVCHAYLTSGGVYRIWHHIDTFKEQVL